MSSNCIYENLVKMSNLHSEIIIYELKKRKSISSKTGMLRENSSFTEIVLLFLPIIFKSSGQL